MAIVQKSILICSKLIIVTVLFVVFFTCIDANAQNGYKVQKIVIDAGHGGEAPGAVGLVYYEKNIVLPVALRLGRLIEERMPEIEVLYTRKKDVNVGFAERADVANKSGADLFISIHANAGLEGDRESSGYETWVMGKKTQENMDIIMRENADMFLEDNYEEKYSDFNSTDSDIIFSLTQASYMEKSIKFAEFVQAEFNGGPIIIDRGIKQGAYIVLWRTAAPSVLIEIGFISNIAEEQKLADVNIQQQIAESIYRAVVKYCNYMNGVIDEEEDDLTQAVPDTINSHIPVSVAVPDSTVISKASDTVTNNVIETHNKQNINKQYRWVTE